MASTASVHSSTTLSGRWLLVLAPATNEEDTAAKRSHATIMRRFRALVAASGDRPVYTTDLCAAIGVSDWTLEICCRSIFSTSPQKYLRRRKCGFIETADGREIYFHRNAVLDGAYRRLRGGSEVRFVEVEGAKGAQASTVRLIGKHHLV